MLGLQPYAETIAGDFKEDGRAYMIGDSPTAGMSSQKETVEVPSKAPAADGCAWQCRSGLSSC